MNVDFPNTDTVLIHNFMRILCFIKTTSHHCTDTSLYENIVLHQDNILITVPIHHFMRILCFIKTTSRTDTSLYENIVRRGSVKYRSQVTGYRSQVTGHRLQVTGYRLQVTGQKNETFGGYVLRPKMMNKTCCG